MTEPHSPADPDRSDAPLSDVEERALDLLDGVEVDEVDARLGAGEIGEGDAGVEEVTHDLDAAVEAQRQARAAVAAAVDVPPAARERAIRAALAERTATSAGDGGAPADELLRHRERRRARTWLAPLVGAAAALVVLAGVIGLVARGSSPNTTSTAASGGATPDGLSAPAGTTTAAGPTNDFGAVTSNGELSERIGREGADQFNATQPAPGAAATPGDGAPSASKSTSAGGATADAAPPSLQAQSAGPARPAACTLRVRQTGSIPAIGPLLTQGTVTYLGTPSSVYVYEGAGGPTDRVLVVVSSDGCRILTTYDF